MQYRPRLTESENKLIQEFRKSNETRVLCIGDLHEPFCLDGYLEFCIEMYKKYNCNKVVFIGDVIDNHYSSYHETDVNGLSGGQELDLAIEKIGMNNSNTKYFIIITNRLSKNSR